MRVGRWGDLKFRVPGYGLRVQISNVPYTHPEPPVRAELVEILPLVSRGVYPHGGWRFDDFDHLFYSSVRGLKPTANRWQAFLGGEVFWGSNIYKLPDSTLLLVFLQVKKAVAYEWYAHSVTASF